MAVVAVLGAVVALGACGISSRAPVAPHSVASTAPEISATVAAAVEATLQARPPMYTNTPGPRSTIAPAPKIVLDEAFGASPKGWPNHPNSTAWYADNAYWLQTREPGRFVAIDAPATAAFHDGVLSARFHKVGGPPGGGYGLILADQGPDSHDGVFQSGRFVVLEASDQGTIGAWERDEDHWIDGLPWTPHAAVHRGDGSNDLTVEATGQQLSFLVNGTHVAQVTTTLPAGRVGIFVGGDGNEVTLEHFKAEWAVPNHASAQQLSVIAIPTSIERPTPTPTRVPVDGLLAQLDIAWSKQNWSEVLSLLDQIQLIAPSAVDFTDKRYAAHVAAAKDLLAKGDRTAAIDEFTKAEHVDPKRGEARAALIALTPTPTPVPQLPGANKPLTQFVGAVLDDIDQFWAKYFNARGGGYAPASRHWYSERTMTRCGPAVPGVQGSFYCVVDAGLYLDVQFIQHIRKKAGDFPVGYAVAHEVGHHVQDQFGITKTAAYILFGQTFSREIELQADCLAGVWSKSAIGRGMAAAEDITQALTLAWTFGDPSWSSQRSADAHGTPDDRTAAFLKGFNGSQAAACGLN